MRKNKRLKRVIRNGLLTLSVIVAIVLFILASFQLSITNPIGMLVMVLAGGYILAFWYANDEVE